LLGEHFAGVGKGLNSAVTAYNRAVGSLESRVLVTARRFVDMGVVGVGEKELAHPATVDANTRALQAPELGAPVLELSLLPGVGDLGDTPGREGANSAVEDGAGPSGASA
jgi:DNA recombination protein RmuC